MAVAKGWPAPIEYVDSGVSGTKDFRKRPQGKLLMQAIDDGQIDVIIIPALDRLGRRAKIILNIADELVARGVALVSCRESIDASTPTGQLILTVLAAIAQLERDLISARTKAAMAVKDERDGELGGKLPYAYVRTPEGIAVDQTTAPIARQIITWRRRGATLRAIAGQLNTEGIPAPLGRKWWATSVREVLLNEPAYKGGKRGASDLRWPKVMGK